MMARMATSSKSSRGGVGFCGALFIAFLVLKLLDKIDWSWWLVSAPLWIPAAVILAFFLLACVVSALSKR